MRKLWGGGSKLPGKGEVAREAESQGDRDKEKNTGSLQGSAASRLSFKFR